MSPVRTEDAVIVAKCRRAAIDVNLVSRMLDRARESTEPESRPDPVIVQGRFARDPSEFSSATEVGQ